MATSRLTQKEIDQLLWEQEKLKEWVGHEGTKIVAKKLNDLARKSILRQLKTDPYKEPEMIVRAQQLRYVITELIPATLEGIINFQPDAPDLQVAPSKKWSLVNWFKGIFARKGT